MAVNYAVYGQPNEWYDSDFQQAELTNKNKTACFDSTQGVPWSSLGLGVDAGRLSWSEAIDNSLSYCGLGRQSSFSTVCYYDNSGQITDTNEREVTNFAFFEKSNDTPTLSDNTFFSTANLDYFTWQTADTLNRINFSRQLKPLTLVNPKNIVLSIFIRATTSNLTGDIDVTLKNYLENYKTTHTLIKDVYIKFWYGNISELGQRDTLPYKYIDNRRPFMISILDEYDMTSKNIKFNAYDIDSPSVFGVISLTNYIGVNDTTSFRMVYCTPTAKNHIVFRTFNDSVYGYIEYYPEFDEDIIKSIACFGLYFTPNDNICQLGSLTNPEMYIGVLDEDGVGRGKYFKGADTVRAPQADPSFIDMHTIDYDPEGVHIDYDTSSHYGILSYYNFNKMYSVTNEQVELLYRELTAAMSAKPNDMTETDYSKGTFLTNDPIDCIISLRKYPIVSTTSSSSIHDIYFGGYKSALSAPYANNAETIRYEFTGTKAFISKYGGGFLDKEGYTTAELFVPFCGSVKLPVNEFIDRTLSVKLIVDYLTGTCTAYIELDGIPRMTINGSIGVDVPVTGIQTNDLQNTINRNIANLKTAQITAGMTARSGASIASGSGSATSAIMSAVNMINPLAIANKMDSTEKALISRDIAEYNLYHTEIPFKAVSAGDALTAGMGEWRCRLSITRPVLSPDDLADPSVYAKTIGYACLKTGKVSDFSGLTVGTIDLSGINCTDKEKAMIIQAFKSGVYL